MARLKKMQGMGHSLGAPEGIVGEPAIPRDGKSLKKLKKSEDSRAPKGFISPQGTFHEVPRGEDHHDWIHHHAKQNHPELHVPDREHKPGENADATYGNALKAGWMSVGIGRDSGGTGHNVQAMHEHLSDRSNPAAQAVREIARKHWGESFEGMLHHGSHGNLSTKRYETAHFLRHGALKENK